LPTIVGKVVRIRLGRIGIENTAMNYIYIEVMLSIHVDTHMETHMPTRTETSSTIQSQPNTFAIFFVEGWHWMEGFYLPQSYPEYC
jgi:hypothetical protein